MAAPDELEEEEFVLTPAEPIVVEAQPVPSRNNQAAATSIAQIPPMLRCSITSDELTFDAATKQISGTKNKTDGYGFAVGSEPLSIDRVYVVEILERVDCSLVIGTIANTAPQKVSWGDSTSYGWNSAGNVFIAGKATAGLGGWTGYETGDKLIFKHTKHCLQLYHSRQEKVFKLDYATEVQNRVHIYGYKGTARVVVREATEAEVGSAVFIDDNGVVSLGKALACSTTSSEVTFNAQSGEISGVTTKKGGYGYAIGEQPLLDGSYFVIRVLQHEDTSLVIGTIAKTSPPLVSWGDSTCYGWNSSSNNVFIAGKSSRAFGGWEGDCADTTLIFKYTKKCLQVYHSKLQRRFRLEYATEDSHRIHVYMYQGSARVVVRDATASEISAFENDNDSVIATTNTTTISNELQLVRKIEAHTAYVLCVIQLENDTIVTGSMDKSIRFWNVKTGEKVKELTGHTGSVRCLQLLDSNCLISGSGDKTLRIWNLNAATSISKEAHTGEVNGLTVLHDGRIVSCSDDKTIKIWRRDISLDKTLEGHEQWVYCVKELPNNIHLVSGGVDNDLKVWDISSGRCIKSLAGHSKRIYSIVVLNDGRVATSSEDYSIKVWDIASETSITQPNAHSSSIFAIAKLPNGDLITGSKDKELKVWKIGSSRLEEKFHTSQHSDGIYNIAVLNDGRVCTASFDKTVGVFK